MKVPGTGMTAAKVDVPNSVGRLKTGTAIGLIFACGLFTAGPAHAGDASLPTGGQVTSGAATIGADGANLTVNQSSDTAIVSWDTFSIGGAASAHFANGTGATLNRVNGSVPSTIDGSLTATGNVYLVNPAGVTVGTGGRVATGGSFVGTTQDVADSDFLDGGPMTFQGASTASAVNAGTIMSAQGDVALIARRVENSGAIAAPNGTAALAAGYKVLMRDQAGAEGKFSVEVGGDDTEAVNTGTIRAAEAEMRANGGNVYALAGNTDNVVKATGVKKSGGRVFLTAGAGGKVRTTQRVVARRSVQKLPRNAPTPTPRPETGGDITVTGGEVDLGGTIDASGTNGGAGGTLVTTGDAVSLTGGARLDASGVTGGTILIGGDVHGGANPEEKLLPGAVATAATLDVAEGATVRADGTVGGGDIVLWSDDHTTFAGNVSATGAGDGDGGFAEISGKRQLGFTGTVDLSAANGATGNLLLDPFNVTISNDDTTEVQETNGTFTPTANDSVVGVDTLLAALQNADVTVSTENPTGAGAGDITVAAPVAWGANTLTLSAAGDIDIASKMSLGVNAGLVLRYAQGSSGGDYIVNAPVDLAPTASFATQKGSGGGLIPYTVISALGAEGSTTGTDLQGMNGGLFGNYVLGSDIDASATAAWNNGKGFDPVGNGATPFAGRLAGLGHEIAGLTINRPATSNVGLFGTASGGIRDLSLSGGSVTGRSRVGALVGHADGARIMRSDASADVSGDALLGVGIGGLVGLLNGAVTQSYASGDVSGGYNVGGLVGTLSGRVSRSFARGDVDGDGSYVGGLIGVLSTSAEVDQAYASGDVTAGAGDVGGLVGHSNGTIGRSYALGSVAGGVQTGGLVGYTSGKVSDSYSTGYVDSSAPTSGGLIGTANVGTELFDVFWDSYTSGRDMALGVGASYTGDAPERVTSDLSGSGPNAFSQTSYGGLNVSSTPGGADWIIMEGRTRPFGIWEQTNNLADAHGLQLTTFDKGRDFRLVADIDASATAGTNYGTEASPDIRYPGMWGARGFVPVGTDADPFKGTLDGAGHKVAGLTIDYSGYEPAGLFGYASDATISDIALEGGTVAGGDEVGALVGRAEDSQIAGVVAEGISVTGGASVGGLIGRFAGGSIAGGSIEDSRAAGAEVSGSGDNVGGLVGFLSQVEGARRLSASMDVDGGDFTGGLVGLAELVSIEDADASGDINGGDNVGGLIGELSLANLSGSQAAGSVDGKGHVGGLVGLQVGIGSNPSTINGSTASASVGGEGDLGGLVGRQIAATIEDSSATGNVLGEAFSQYVGGLVGQQDGDSKIADSQAKGDVAGYRSVGGLAGSAAGEIAGSQAFGSVSGLGMSSPSNFGGLVGQLSGGTIKESSAAGTVAVSFGSAASVGGLVGLQSGGDITSSHASGDVGVTSTGYSVGGLIGYKYGGGSLSHVYATGDVSGGSTLGGLVGYMGVGDISDAYAIGDVTGGNTLGGLIGYKAASGAISEAYATGDVSGGDTLGGLVGFMSGNGGLSSVYASGDVTGGDTLGGLIGYKTATGAINEAYASGDVEGGNTLGGLIGYNVAGDITRAYAAGGVKGTDTIGGLVGFQANGAIMQTYATGRVSGAADAGALGGLVGARSGGTTASSFWDEQTTGQPASSGGGTALDTAEFQDTAGFMMLAGAAGWDFNGVWAPPSGGYYPELYALSRVARVDLEDMATIRYGDASPDAVVAGVYGGPGAYAFAPDGDTLAAPTPDQPAYGLDVGEYSITSPVSASSTGGETYRFVYTNNQFTIVPASLTITADAGQSKIYGESDPVLTYETSGLRAGDTSAILSGMLSRQGGENVGSYAIGQGTLDTGSNYTVDYMAADFAVTPRALTITADDALRIYGDANPATGTATGDDLVNGDTIAGVDLFSPADATSDVGAYDLSVSNATGTGLSNYAITYATNAGGLRVTPRALTITADDVSRIYGDANPATGTATGDDFVNGDTIAAVDLFSPADAASDVGVYDLSASNATGTGLSNYAISYATNGDGLTVTPRALTITADDVSRIYGDANPALTARVTGGSLAPFDDSLADALLGFSLTTNASQTSPVGAYAITISGANANYALTLRDGTLTVSKNPKRPFGAVERWPKEGVQPATTMDTQTGTGNGDDGTVCVSGALGPDCAALPWPTNRTYGPWLSAAAN